MIEARNWTFENPLSISASGREVVGLPQPGLPLSFHINMDQVYVCEKGKSVLTGFPEGVRAKVAKGARLGRCEFLD